MTDQPHARAFDLPGWPCPPRVRDIPSHENSWGLVLSLHQSKPTVAQDDLGFLRANGDAVPSFATSSNSPHFILFWTETGLGVYVEQQWMRNIGNVSKLDMQPGQWIPIAVAAAELPAFVKGAQ